MTALPCSGAPGTPSPSSSLRHRPHDDVQALLAGTLFVAMALLLFAHAGLLIGGTAGLAFVLHELTGLSFGKLFFAVNLPFYGFAWRLMGREFTLKTFCAVGLLSGLSEMFPHVIHVDYLNPLFAALFGGLLLGAGCLFLARHQASLGGATIVSLYLQKHHGMRAGKAQLVLDGSVLLAALCVVSWERVAYSILAAAVMSGFLWLNHRPGRYRADSVAAEALPERLGPQAAS